MFFRKGVRESTQHEYWGVFGEWFGEYSGEGLEQPLPIANTYVQGVWCHFGEGLPLFK